MNDSLVWLSDHDRTILFEAGNVLRELALEDERARLGYLAGRLHGLAGRAPAEEKHGLTAAQEELRRRHSLRFRRVSNRYPCRVAEAYERDLERAAADSDEQVAATVAAWERARGFEPVDWRATGAEERDESGQHFEPAIVTFDISNVCLVYEDSEEGSDERRG